MSLGSIIMLAGDMISVVVASLILPAIVCFLFLVSLLGEVYRACDVVTIPASHRRQQILEIFFPSPFPALSPSVLAIFASGKLDSMTSSALIPNCSAISNSLILSSTFFVVPIFLRRKLGTLSHLLPWPRRVSLVCHLIRNHLCDHP